MPELEYDHNNVWHVYPVNDLKEHDTESPACHCNPTVELQDNGGLVVIHNSYDGRELKERNEKTN